MDRYIREQTKAEIKKRDLHSGIRRNCVLKKLKAIFFDQDGVIADTERYGHRTAFNRTFKKNGLDIFWNEKKYGELLHTGGGKERMNFFFHQEGLFRDYSADRLDSLIRKLHEEKTEELIGMIRKGELPLRPGIKRLMTQAGRASLILGICTTSHERNARAFAGKLLPEIKFDFILAGDCVSKKKPDPEIYLLALKKAGIKPEEGIVIEDSNIGIKAATAAGLRVVATVNGYTENEDMSCADVVLSSLGDENGTADLIGAKGEFSFNKIVNLDDIRNYFET